MRLHCTIVANILFALGCLNVALARPGTPLNQSEPRTNSERLAHGLGPLKPRKLYDPSKAFSARAAIPSNYPPGTTVKGATAVYGPGTNGKRDNFLGYLTISGGLSATPSWYNQFSFVVPSDMSQVIEVKALQYRYSDPYICGGAVSGPMIASYNPDGTKTWFNYDLTPTSTTYVVLFSMVQEPYKQDNFNALPGSPAAYMSGVGFWVEANTWRVNPATGTVSFVWTNFDGSQPEITWCLATNKDGGKFIRGAVNTDLLATTSASNQYDPETISGCGLSFVFDSGVVTVTN